VIAFDSPPPMNPFVTGLPLFGAIVFELPPAITVD